MNEKDQIIFDLVKAKSRLNGAIAAAENFGFVVSVWVTPADGSETTIVNVSLTQEL